MTRVIQFDNGRTARFSVVTGEADLPTALTSLGDFAGRPVIVLVGGAGGLEETGELRSLCDDVIVPVSVQLGACLLDGGTDSGIMRLLGQAVARRGLAIPLVGIAAIGTVRVPGEPTPPASTDSAFLEPHHTGFVLVPGASWGDESPWITRAATLIARDSPSLTLVVNGGAITLDDAERSVAAKRPLVIVAGTGRMADTIAGAGSTDDDPRVAALATSPFLQVRSITEPSSVAEAMLEALR